MEITKKGNNIIVKHKLKRGQIYRFQKGSSVESFTILNKPQVVSGYSNVCQDGMQILLIDYDGVDISVITEDWNYLSKNHTLSEAFVFKTDKGYHVVCLSRYYPAFIYQLLKMTRCDDNYKDMCLRNPYRSYVLRMSPKKGGHRPRYVMTLPGNSTYHEISTAHKNLLKRLYPRLRFENYKEDKLKKLKLTLYETK